MPTVDGFEITVAFVVVGGFFFFRFIRYNTVFLNLTSFQREIFHRSKIAEVYRLHNSFHTKI